MRCNHLVLGVFVGAVALACDAKESESASAKVEAKAAADGAKVAKVEGGAAAEAEASAKVDGEVDAEATADAEVEIQPRIGGTIVAAGDYAVEILAFIDGRIEAIVMGADGEVVADASALKVAAKLAAEGDARADVALSWDAPSARFVGQVAADVALVPGPVEVTVDVASEASVGALAELGLAVQARHGGQVMMAGNYSLEVVAQAGVVHAYAFDVAGQAHAAGDLDLELELDADTKVKLVWDPPSASYHAKIDGDLDLEAKPVVVRVAADGRVAVAAVHSFHASAAVAAKGELDARAEVRPPSVSAKADASGNAGASAKASGKASAKAKSEGSASGGASGKASAKTGGGIKGGIGGSAKAKGKVGIKLGG